VGLSSREVCADCVFATLPDDGVFLLLDIQNLRVNYAGDTDTLRDLCLQIAPGETVALTGPSGTGKSTVVWSILQLLPRDCIVSGSIKFDGVDLRTQSAAVLQRLRGGDISCIPQQPALAAHPLIRLGRQIEDVLKSHHVYSTNSRREILEFFRRVGLPEDCFTRYPHQLSGGQLQRAAIAQALVCRPKLLIADEPFAALDSLTQQDVLSLFREIKNSFALSMLLISHDPRPVSALADRVLALENGGIAWQSTP